VNFIYQVCLFIFLKQHLKKWKKTLGSIHSAQTTMAMKDKELKNSIKFFPKSAHNFQFGSYSEKYLLLFKKIKQKEIALRSNNLNSSSFFYQHSLKEHPVSA